MFDNALNEMPPDISMAFSNSDLDSNEQPNCGACAEVVHEHKVPILLELGISRKGKQLF